MTKVSKKSQTKQSRKTGVSDSSFFKNLHKKIETLKSAEYDLQFLNDNNHKLDCLPGFKKIIKELEEIMKKNNELKDYDNLECPKCDCVCSPTKLNKNESVGYTHNCIGGTYTFKISKDGDLVE